MQLNAAFLLDRLQDISSLDSLRQLRQAVCQLQAHVTRPDSPLFRTAGCPAEDLVEMDPAFLNSELDQISAAHSIARAQYYVNRLAKSITVVRTSPINDINLYRWKEYDHLLTDSLWLIERRDSSGVHRADYWGNFIPQIPRQMMLRYTKQGEWVLDPFAGAGTTAIEAQRLGRHSIGIELQAEVVDQARQLVAAEPNHHNVVAEILSGDSRTLDYPALLARHGQGSVQLVILHPPYHDIIKFSADARDLSNAPSVDDFLEQMAAIVAKARQVLDGGRFMALVIGDKYAGGEWIPLGFLTMQVVMERGFALKSIIVKNLNKTTGKRARQDLWRYRALVGGFYIFKHEYIFVFQKR